MYTDSMAKIYTFGADKQLVSGRVFGHAVVANIIVSDSYKAV